MLELCREKDFVIQAESSYELSEDGYAYPDWTSEASSKRLNYDTAILSAEICLIRRKYASYEYMGDVHLQNYM